MIKNILGVSAGNGVILYPFKNQLIANIEIRPDYLIKGQPIQWHLNFEQPFYRTWNPDLKNVEVIVGHPKCGHSSMFALSRGKQFTSHVDEPSLTLFFKAVSHYQPKIFLLENLPKFLDSFDDIRNLFENYTLTLLHKSVSEFGNSQVSRKRLIMIGLRKDYYRESTFRTLHDVFQITKPTTTKVLLANLPQNGHIKESIEDIITMYSGYKISLTDAKQFWQDNPKLRHWPVKEGKMNTAPGVYINRFNDIPLTVRKTNRQFNPDGEQMSPRELARIQGIPDDFKLLDSYPGVTTTTLINKGRITVANTPPMEIPKWFGIKLRRLKYLFFKDPQSLQ